jgi:two-component system catabolic regulation response regulator CreB
MSYSCQEWLRRPGRRRTMLGATVKPPVPPARPRVLLLEDDPAIARTVAFALEREGHAVQHVLLVGEAQAVLARQAVDVLVLDVGLPDGNGIDLCRALRQSADPRQRTLPVLMLSARSEEIDRVLGLEMGADDYLIKPFSPREMVARVRALLRRAAMSPPVPAPAAPPLFEVDDAGQRIRYAGQWLSLTRLEHGLLRTLLSAPARIHRREALLDAVWGPGSEATDRNVDTQVKTLRAKLREVTPGNDPIVTHRGLGYGLETTNAAQSMPRQGFPGEGSAGPDG